MIVIWSGFGFLWLGGFALGFVLGASAAAEYEIGMSPPVVGLWGGLVVGFVISRGLDDDEHTLFFVSLPAWNFVALIVAIGCTAYSFREPAKRLLTEENPDENEPKERIVDQPYDLPTKMRVWRDDGGEEINAILEDVIVGPDNKPVVLMVRDDGKRFRFSFRRLDQEGELFVEKCWREKVKRK